MKYRPIGDSGLISSNLTLGTMIFGEKTDRSTPEKEALDIIDHYIDAGGNHLDTADVYGGGNSERIVGKALQGRRQKLILATKVRFPTSEDPNSVGLSRGHIIAGVEASLKRLQTDYIDLLYLHGWDPITPLHETLRALEDLIRAGKVRYLGLSNFKAWQLMKIQALCDQLNTNRFIGAQYQYSLVKRDIEYEFFDLYASEGLGLLPWGPLGGGFLTGKYNRETVGEGRLATSAEEVEESWARRNTEKNWRILGVLQSIARAHNRTISQVAIAWLFTRSIIPSVIIGVRTMEQLKDNLGANDFQLTGSELQRLEEVSTLPELYPYRMIEAYSTRTFV